MTDEIILKPGTAGSARVEYYICRETVENLLAQDYTVRSIYDYLKKQGWITCCYCSFCAYANGRRSNDWRR